LKALASAGISKGNVAVDGAGLTDDLFVLTAVLGGGDGFLWADMAADLAAYAAVADAGFPVLYNDRSLGTVPGADTAPNAFFPIDGNIRSHV